MATNFPTSKDTLNNPQSSDPQNNPSHSAQHANANDAIEALEDKVGIDGSGDANSLDYRVNALENESAGLGSWASATIGSATQATSAGFLVGFLTVDSSSIQVKTDANSTPTTVRAKIDGLNNGLSVPFCVPVKKDDYYLIEYLSGSSGCTAYFIPLS